MTERVSGSQSLELVWGEKGGILWQKTSKGLESGSDRQNSPQVGGLSFVDFPFTLRIPSFILLALSLPGTQVHSEAVSAEPLRIPRSGYRV